MPGPCSLLLGKRLDGTLDSLDGAMSAAPRPRLVRRQRRRVGGPPDGAISAAPRPRLVRRQRRRGGQTRGIGNATYMGHHYQSAGISSQSQMKQRISSPSHPHAGEAGPIQERSSRLVLGRRTGPRAQGGGLGASMAGKTTHRGRGMTSFKPPLTPRRTSLPTSTPLRMTDRNR